VVFLFPFFGRTFPAFRCNSSPLRLANAAAGFPLQSGARVHRYSVSIFAAEFLAFYFSAEAINNSSQLHVCLGIVFAAFQPHFAHGAAVLKLSESISYAPKIP